MRDVQKKRGKIEGEKEGERVSAKEGEGVREGEKD